MRLSRTILNTPRLRHIAALELLSVRAQGYRFQRAYSRRAMYRRAAAQAMNRAHEAFRVDMLSDAAELDAIATAALQASYAGITL
jgi:hypothetical protein